MSGFIETYEWLKFRTNYPLNCIKRGLVIVSDVDAMFHSMKKDPYVTSVIEIGPKRRENIDSNR